MILRPETDRELLTLVGVVLGDGRLDADTRAVLAGLLARREIENFPLLADLGAAVRMSIGPERGRRMLNDMRRAGYLVRARWAVPYVGRRPLYSSLCGPLDLVVVAVSQLTSGTRPATQAAVWHVATNSEDIRSAKGESR